MSVSVTFTVKGNLYHVTKSELSPVLLFSISVVPGYVRSIRIVLDSFYLGFFFFEKFFNLNLMFVEGENSPQEVVASFVAFRMISLKITRPSLNL